MHHSKYSSQGGTGSVLSDLITNTPEINVAKNKKIIIEFRYPDCFILAS
jgi:hypothetical protein